MAEASVVAGARQHVYLGDHCRACTGDPNQVMRSSVTSLPRIALVANYSFGRDLRDDFRLPNIAWDGIADAADVCATRGLEPSGRGLLGLDDRRRFTD
jgi:hypothetical protein